MKPDSWQKLPASMWEWFLWDCNLDYDCYESSKAEVIHDICNNPKIHSRNNSIINQRWQSMKEHDLVEVAKQHIASAEQSISELTIFIGELTNR